MKNFIELIKIKMVRFGRDDFVNYLAEILGISKQWASAKLNGKTEFTFSDIVLLTKKLGFSAEELKNAFTE